MSAAAAAARPSFVGLIAWRVHRCFLENVVLRGSRLLLELAFLPLTVLFFERFENGGTKFAFFRFIAVYTCATVVSGLSLVRADAKEMLEACSVRVFPRSGIARGAPLSLLRIAFGLTIALGLLWFRTILSQVGTSAVEATLTFAFFALAATFG